MLFSKWQKASCGFVPERQEIPASCFPVTKKNHAPIPVSFAPLYWPLKKILQLCAANVCQTTSSKKKNPYPKLFNKFLYLIQIMYFSLPPENISLYVVSLAVISDLQKAGRRSTSLPFYSIQIFIFFILHLCHLAVDSSEFKPGCILVSLWNM